MTSRRWMHASIESWTKKRQAAANSKKIFGRTSIKRDEVKLVMGSREDYEWSCDKVRKFDLTKRCRAVLFSPIFGRISPRQIVEWILEDKLGVRFQLQMHKFIWTPTARGV